MSAPRFATFRLALLLACWFILPGLAAASGHLPAPSAASPEELAERRRRVAEAVGADALVLLVSPEPAVRNGDVEWPFRQGDDLYYLTGIRQPGTALALLPGEPEHREILFVSDANPMLELWTGPVLDRAGARAASGIAEVVSIGRLEGFLGAALGGRFWGESDLYTFYRPPGMPAFLAAVRSGRATVWLDLADRGSQDPREPLPPALARAERIRRRFPEVAIRDLSPLAMALREVKGPAERAHLARAVEITEAAIGAGMRRSLTADSERQVQATIEFHFRDLGACCWGYPSIVGAGRNATILHYPDPEGPIVRDGLVLVDAGADVGGYSADVTRTWPADGTFSPAQREVYEAVLAVWDDCLPRLTAGTLYADVHLHAERAFARELARLGLAPSEDVEWARLYFPHGLGHPIGLGVHDVWDRTRKLEPGMVWTIEPGLYVRRRDVEASGRWRDLDEPARQRVAAALDRYDGLGVRIEDDVEITGGAPVVLSYRLPRTVAEIERFLAGGE